MYVWNLEKNLAALEETMKALRARRADVLTKVQMQEREGLQRLNEVEGWLTSVENIQNQVYELLLPRRDELENLSSSHSYGKSVFEMLKEVEDLETKGAFGEVAGPPKDTIAEEVEMPLPSTIVGHVTTRSSEVCSSYDSLKDEHVKSCFQYCALFPEDTSIEKEKLVDYWICEGFIDEKQGLTKAKDQAYGVIGTLVEACLLTQEEECESYVRMHDVVREMALWIASDFGKDKERCIVKPGARLSQVPTVENWRSVRRMSLMDNKIENISDSPNCPELTTLLLQRNMVVNISGEFFKSIPKLVVLDLSHNNLSDGLPEEISKLVSLRFLDLSGNKDIQRLFTSLLELTKLIYLNLEDTELRSISGISNLLKLRTLRLRYNQTLRDTNVMEELQLLEDLEMVTIDIRSILVADQLVNAYRAGNAIQAMHILFLEEKSVLTLPDMPLLSTLDMFRSEMVEIDIKRRTSSSLTTLRKLHQYLPIESKKVPVNKSPTTPGFPDLSAVTLRDCHGLRDLTWLLFAPNLRALEIDSLNQVEDIISKEKAVNILTEEEEAGTTIPFRKLEFFQVYNLPKLKSIYWSPLPFPRLREFNIYNCPNMRKLPLDSRSGSSIELVIHNGEQYYRDKVEWEDEATKERFLRCINPSLY